VPDPTAGEHGADFVKLGATPYSNSQRLTSEPLAFTHACRSAEVEVTSVAVPGDTVGRSGTVDVVVVDVVVVGVVVLVVVVVGVVVLVVVVGEVVVVVVDELADVVEVVVGDVVVVVVVGAVVVVDVLVVVVVGEVVVVLVVVLVGDVVVVVVLAGRVSTYSTSPVSVPAPFVATTR
jgi:hypothetical protein